MITRRGRHGWGCIWVALMLAVLAAAGCSRSSSEQRLRERMAGLQASVEQRDAAAVREFLAEDFVGPEGLDRALRQKHLNRRNQPFVRKRHVRHTLR